MEFRRPPFAKNVLFDEQEVASCQRIMVLRKVCVVRLVVSADQFFRALCVAVALLYGYDVR